MKGSLENIIHEISLNLVKVSIFYIPESFLDLLKVEKTKKVMEDVNKIVLFDKDGLSLNTEKTQAGLFIMKKKGFLNENIFLLYDFKENNSKGGFEYVVEKYCELMQSFLYLSEWLKNHAQKTIDNLTDDQATAFNLQYQFYLEHKQEFEVKFNKQTQVFALNDHTTKTVLDNFKPIVPKINKRFVQTIANNGLEKQKRIEKLKHDTRVNAENFLLRTVFNLKFDENH
jgi:hypothetical protein